MTAEAAEAAFVAAFIERSRQERVLLQLRGKRRGRFCQGELPHFAEFDRRFCKRVPTREQNREGILALLRGRGAPERCHVISADGHLDGQTMPLEDALEQTVGESRGTIIICNPGALAYFEGEEHGMRLLLCRPRR